MHNKRSRPSHRPKLPSPYQLCQRAGIALLLATAALWLAACLSLPLPQWSQAQRVLVPTPTPRPATTPVTLLTWPGPPTEMEHLDQILALLQRRQPDLAPQLLVQENFENRVAGVLAEQTTTTRAPDVVHLNLFALPDLVAKGLLAPLDPQLLEQADPLPVLRNALQVNGVPYCIPSTAATLALLYNKQIFDAANLPYPTAAWDWEALRSTAAALAEPTQGRYGLIVAPDFSRWLPFLYQAGGAVTTADFSAMTLTEPAAQSALDFYVKLIRDSIAATPATVDSQWAGQAFAQERVAMIMEGNWMIPYLQANAPTLDYGVAPLPMGPMANTTVIFGACYALPINAPSPDAGVQLIQFLTSADVQTSWISLNALLPARRALGPAWAIAYPDYRAYQSGIDQAQVWQLGVGFQPLVEQINTDLEKVYGGFIPTETVLIEADKVGAEILNGN
ncbi:MAG: sugar ABC transporter substrate-binding protein [Caldilineaceae bacterium]